jgi:serine/threonine protein phosphatase PrpC
MLETLHQSLMGSRGAVGAVAKINFQEGKLAYAGLGNIAAVLVTRSECKHLTSLNGTLGYEARKITEFTLPWSGQSTLVMYSDGLSSKTAQDLATIDVESTSSAMIAASLFLYQAKSTDDATVLVVKQ